MADESQDESQKTEEPTHKRLQDALKRGQIFSSKEVSNLAILMVLALALALIFPVMFKKTAYNMAPFIQSPHRFAMDMGNIQILFTDIFLIGLAIMGMIGGAAIVAALVSNFMQHDLVFSAEPMKPKLEKISILKGFKRIFSMKSVVEFVKGLLKITLMGAIGLYAAWPHQGYLQQLPNYELIESLQFIDAILIRMLIGICSAMVMLAIIDYLYQRFEYIKSMRMSRKEIKDEYKEQEGDPHIKAKIKSIRMERARKRMMAAVPEADVVVTNPTHYAVAMKYETGKMPAPMVVAKGVDQIALNIREVAERNNVPLVENRPLARALYDNVEIDEIIPEEHYQAVAEIISYVYKLKGKMN